MEETTQDYTRLSLDQLNALLQKEDQALFEYTRAAKTRIRKIRRLRDAIIEDESVKAQLAGLSPGQKERLLAALSQEVKPGSVAGKASAGNAG